MTDKKDQQNMSDYVVVKAQGKQRLVHKQILRWRKRLKKHGCLKNSTRTNAHGPNPMKKLLKAFG